MKMLDRICQSGLKPLLLWVYQGLLGSLKLLGFVKDYLKFRCMCRYGSKRDDCSTLKLFPCLSDRLPATGFDRHYIYHTAWAARILAHSRPLEHVDISSSLYFCSIVSAFIPFKFYDYRPAELHLSGLQSGFADVSQLNFSGNSIMSLSCMHVVEHVGLGRYGDPLNPDGDLKVFDELKRVLAIGGLLLLVVPVGSPCIVFNAHRIYSYDCIVSLFSNFILEDFSLIPDEESDGGLIPNATKQQADEQVYGCGCFCFRKIE